MFPRSKGSGTAEDNGEVEASPSFRMGFFIADSVRYTMEQILCPKCGELITRVARAKGVMAYYPKKELSGQCTCGQKYSIKLSSLNSLIISFPDRETVSAC